jgi:hypothetical protein
MEDAAFWLNQPQPTHGAAVFTAQPLVGGQSKRRTLIARHEVTKDLRAVQETAD